MKIKHFFGLAVIAAMTASCSSNEDLGTAGPGTGTNEAGVGYVAFNINLPTQSGSSSRASSENDQFDDGTPNEYDVKDATLLVFEGANEADALFKGAYKLNTTPWNDKKANENVTTTSATIVKEIDAPASADDCYALVVLNKNDVFTLNESNHAISLDGASDFTGKYEEFANSLSDKKLTKNGFYMANAPLSDVAGGTVAPTSAKITTLVSLKDKIKETESEAKKSPAQIYVERGVAKVTMENPSITEVDGSYTDATQTTKVPFKVTSWALDNTNKKTYLVRSAKGSDGWLNLATEISTVAAKYRFVGSTPVATGVSLFRTYFAKDANFNETENATALTSKSFNKINASDITNALGSENPLYCFENTFDVASQKDNTTTRVLLKANLNSGSTFYVINGDENIIYKKDDVIKEIKKYFLTEYDSWIKANVTIASGSVGKDNLNVDITNNAGEVTINSITFTNGATTTATLPTGYQQTVKDRVGTIQEYKDGESYYFVRIKHFGDDLTPWNVSESVKPSSADGVYPSGPNQDNNYLGRYGVLRNNWYDIQITGVKGLGSATVPDVTSVPDDELKSYIAVKINVLSWAKRSQSVVL